MSETKEEHERKWLVTSFPPSVLERKREQKIRQGYLAVTDAGSARVRSIDCEGLFFYFMTVKLGKGISRGEHEIVITQDLFEQLWEKTEARLEKRRYSWPDRDQGCQLDLDFYDSPLDGLVTVEVESPIKRFVTLFQPLTWFGREVTGMSEYTNAMLATKGLPQNG